MSDVHVWGDTKKRFEVLKVAYKEAQEADHCRRQSMNTETDIAARCQEFTDALTEVLAENAIGLARRGRLARAHAAIKHHPRILRTCFLRRSGDCVYAVGSPAERWPVNSEFLCR